MFFANIVNAQGYDIGLINLDRAFSITDFIRPVCLPAAAGKLETGSEYLWFVTGWGTTTSDSKLEAKTLQRVQVNIHSLELYSSCFWLSRPWCALDHLHSSETNVT